MENNSAIITRKPEPGNNEMIKKLILSHPFAIIALLLLSVLGTLFSLVTPLIMGLLIDQVLIGKNTELLFPVIVGMSCIFLVSAVSNYLSSNIRGKLNLTLFKELSGDLYNAVQIASYKELQKFKTGDLLSRTLGNSNAALQTVTTIIPQIIITTFSMVMPVFIMLYLNPKLTAISMSPAILFIFSSWYYGNKTKFYQRRALDSSANMNSFLKEAFSIVPLIKVFKLENWMHSRFNTKMSDYYETSLDVVKVSTMSSTVGMLIYGIPSILVLTFGSWEVLNGSMSLGTFTAFMGYVAMFFAPIQMLSMLWTNYKGSLASFDRINEILSIKKDVWGDNRLPKEISGIVFEGIWFSYEGREIFKDFHMTLKKGRNYIIGDNGSGKTTLIELLCGLYRPDNGKILIGGQDLISVNKESLRESVSVVFSDALLFDGTIYENILIGNPSASRQEVIIAAKRAELHDFIMSLSKQYETEVGESGLNLSSGEKQKIALARVILRDTCIIIFDEFTRSIDVESKKSIYSVIRQFKDKIIIIITHDMNDVEADSNQITLKKVNSMTI